MDANSRSNLSEPVYQHLIQMLLNMELKPGDHISENKIAQDLGISRTPIREALRRLENDGVVNLFPNRFAEVISIDRKDIIQLGQARIAIDVMLTKLAIYHGSNADFLYLRQLADHCTECTKTNNLPQRAQADIDFHHALAELSRNNVLIKMQEELSLRVKILTAWKYIINDGAYERSFDHQKLVAALIERNEAQAVRVATDHLVQFYSLNDEFPPCFYVSLL